jgi:hypothetical protein
VELDELGIIVGDGTGDGVRQTFHERTTEATAERLDAFDG